jgi:hypothetical protein
VLRLAEDQVLEHLVDQGGAEFMIDSRIVDRWIRQENGDWRGNRNLSLPEIKGKINLRPRLLLSNHRKSRCMSLT